MPATPDRPHWPRCGASAIILRGDEVLLMQRAKGTFTGLWSIPGGHIEPGEKAAEAARREVREETSIEAKILGLIDVHDIIARRDDGTLASHYLLAVHYGVWLAGEPVAASDARDARFFPLHQVASLPLTASAADFIARAARLVEAATRDGRA